MSARTPRRADAQRNREAILRAARDLVIARGPEVGMDDIAAAAGVAVGTLYRHFPTKRDLIEAIVTDLESLITASLDAALARVDAGASTALDELVGLLRQVTVELREERLLRHAATGVADDSLHRLRTGAAAAVDRLVAAAHRERALYPDVTVDDVVLLLTTAPGDTATAATHYRWLALARRALSPISAARSANSPDDV
ncbi:AcrR family transcriptional regulator [Nocardia transvalensis]|uniref:AcrR family transcriptional regulator n=1 Tax=Nocardia transvalensis TaxID=37333 RepID=A0A7W9PKZ2_9NOCA|nr:helix-turn-helix domain-containing protein [Nocardia transvalensis]MBB5918114.1 AcrR family transcriptional regulator [Nocardia transvalensis]